MQSKEETKAFSAVYTAGENACNAVPRHTCGAAPDTPWDDETCGTYEGSCDECNLPIDWMRDGDGGLFGECGAGHRANAEECHEGVAEFLVEGGSNQPRPPPCLEEIDEELYAITKACANCNGTGKIRLPFFMARNATRASSLEDCPLCNNPQQED